MARTPAARRPPGRATLSDVAAAAGVSPSTASLAFSGAGPVAPATRERVLAAAADLGYSGPDPTAVSLRRGRSGVVGVVVGERLRDAFRDPYVVGLLDGLVDELAGAGLAILLLPMTHDLGAPPAEQYRTASMDAVVFATGGLREDPALAVLTRRRLPLVAVEGPDVPEASVVRVDDRRGSADAVRLLVGLGHRDVAVATMPLRHDGRGGLLDAARRAGGGYADATNRLDGVHDVLAPVAVWETTANAVEQGREAGHRLLSGAAGARPTAVVAQSDVLAAGVLQACAELGLRVPEDVSVVGFDGVAVPWLLPHRLTTLVQPVDLKARTAAEMLLARLAGGDREDRTLAVELRTGTTSGPVPAR